MDNRFTSLDLETVRATQAQFARDRDWDQFHTPRNLLLAFVGEVGELSEVFQWKGEVKRGLPEFTKQEREHVGQEMSDCLLYLIRMADVCGVDLGAACMAKIQANAAKYPVERCRGSAAKYTAYDPQAAGALAPGAPDQQAHAPATDSSTDAATQAS